MVPMSHIKLETTNPLKTIKHSEVICALFALSFLATGCWVGYIIAFNGLVSHTSKALNHSFADKLIVIDIVCNVALVSLVLATTTWHPESLIVCLVGVAGFAISFTTYQRIPYTAACVHCVFVMGCGLINVTVWCACCNNRLSLGF